MTKLNLQLPQSARDTIFVHSIAEIRAIKFLLTSLYAKVFDMPYEEAVATAKATEEDALHQIVLALAKYGDISAPDLRQSLGL